MKLKSFTALLLALILSLSLAACGKTVEGKVVATVGKQSITETDLDHFMRLFAFVQGHDLDAIPEKDMDAVRKTFLNERINLELIKQYYKNDEKVLKDTGYKDQAAQYLKEESTKKFLAKYKIPESAIRDFVRDQFFVSPFVEELRKELPAPSAEQLKNYYDEHQEQYKEQNITAQHILVKEDQEALAKELVARLKKGEDFAALAKKYSIDPGSKEKGGDLGTFDQNVNFDPVFKQAVFNLEPDAISEPVKTQFGWHIIKVNKKETVPMTFEQAEPSIKQMMENNALLEAYNRKLTELKEKIGVTMPKTEQPKTEQPAGEQPKTEQPAGEQPKAEQPAGE